MTSQKPTPESTSQDIQNTQSDDGSLEFDQMNQTIQSYLKIMIFAVIVAVVFWLLLMAILRFDKEVVGSLGTLGDYFGGMLNPFFAFMAFLLLSHSIRLQLKEMAETRRALQETSAETRRAAEAQERVALAQEAAANAQKNAAVTQNQLLMSQVSLEELQREILESQKEYYESALKQQKASTLNELFFKVFDSMVQDFERFFYKRGASELQGSEALRFIVVDFIKECKAEVMKYDREIFSNEFKGFLTKKLNDKEIDGIFFYFPNKVFLLLSFISSVDEFDGVEKDHYIRLIASSLSLDCQRYLFIFGVYKCELREMINKLGLFLYFPRFNGDIYKVLCVFYEKEAYGGNEGWIDIYNMGLEGKKRIDI